MPAILRRCGRHKTQPTPPDSGGPRPGGQVAMPGRALDQVLQPRRALPSCHNLLRWRGKDEQVPLDPRSTKPGDINTPGSSGQEVQKGQGPWGGQEAPLAPCSPAPSPQETKEEVRELGTGGKERKQALRSVPSGSHLQSSSNRGWSGVGGAAHLPSCLPGPSCPHSLQGPGGGAPRSHPTPTTDLTCSL